MGSCKTPCYPHGDVVCPLNGGIWWMQKQKKNWSKQNHLLAGDGRSTEEKVMGLSMKKKNERTV